MYPAFSLLFVFISSLLCQIYHQYPDSVPRLFVNASNPSRNNNISSDEMSTFHHYLRHPSQHFHSVLGMNYMLPPAPITPFRGGLRTVSNNNSSSNKIHDGSDNNSGPINKSKSESILEASSSDHHDEDQEGMLHSSTSSTPLGSTAGVSSWTPEEYPDPWTNPLVCGGAATASLLNSNVEGQRNDIQQQILKDDGGVDSEFMHWFYIPATLGEPSAINDENNDSDGSNENVQMEQENQSSQLQQKQRQQPSRLLFCDPDQVLNKETLRTVAEKLEAFSNAFAHHVVSFNSTGFSNTRNNDGAGSLKTDEGVKNDSEANDNVSNAEADEVMDIPRTFPQYSEHEVQSVANSTSASTDSKEDGFEDLELRWVPDEQVSSGDSDIANSQDSDKHMNDAEDSDNRVLSQLLQDLFIPKVTQQRLYSDSVGGVYSAIPPDMGRRNEAALMEPIEVAIALVKKVRNSMFLSVALPSTIRWLYSQVIFLEP